MQHQLLNLEDYTSLKPAVRSTKKRRPAKKNKIVLTSIPSVPVNAPAIDQRQTALIYQYLLKYRRPCCPVLIAAHLNEQVPWVRIHLEKLRGGDLSPGLAECLALASVQEEKELYWSRLPFSFIRKTYQIFKQHKNPLSLEQVAEQAEIHPIFAEVCLEILVKCSRKKPQRKFVIASRIENGITLWLRLSVERSSPSCLHSIASLPKR